MVVAMPNASNILSALFGTLMGAALAWLAGRQQHRLTLTLEMHREFNSSDMLGARYRAGELLESHLALDLRAMQASLGKSTLLDVGGSSGSTKGYGWRSRSAGCRAERSRGFLARYLIGGTSRASGINSCR
jgi:hypothetical protein